MRIRVSGARLAKERKKLKTESKSFRQKRTVFSNKNGRIQLKDLNGKSYMKMGFYKRIELESTKKRIIELRDTEIENNI